MKSKTFNTPNMTGYWFTLLVGLLLAVQPAWAGNEPKREFTKTITREFGTLPNGMTALYNKYGKVNVNTWQNNFVKIDVNIIVNANEQRDADKMFERIQVNFANTAGYIKAETVIMQGNGWWPAENVCQDFKINYEVWMPVGNQLDLKNKYGNAYVANLNGKLFADIKYGDLRTETVNNDVDLNMAYGKAYLAKANHVYGALSYGGISITDVRELQLESKYSNYSVDNAGALRVTSKYDNFELGNISDLRLQTKYSNVRLKQAKILYVTAQYTDIKIGAVSDVLDADLAYGQLKIESLNRGFSNANVNAKYTDVYIFTERGANYRFDAEGSYTGLRYPSGATIKRHDERGTSELVEGFVGDANAKGLMRVKVNYGGFTLK